MKEFIVTQTVILTQFCDAFVCLFVGEDSGGQWLEEKCGGHVWNGREEENVWCSTVNKRSQSTSANMQVYKRIHGNQHEVKMDHI